MGLLNLVMSTDLVEGTICIQTFYTPHKKIVIMLHTFHMVNFFFIYNDIEIHSQTIIYFIYLSLAVFILHVCKIN